MSTYDGAAYVEQQVESILAQTHGDLRLTVRDDGSRDGTLDVLARWSEDPRVSVHPGDNVGLPHAFFRLIEESADDVDFWALADQDDVWEPDKIARAASRLAGMTGPALYCARVLVVDERLRPLYPHVLPRRGPSFANALAQNIATGCTIVLNREARDVLRGRWPTHAVMHDAWLYAVLAGTGSVVYDPHLVVRYRQHGDNSVGMGRGPVARVAGRVRRQLSPGGAGQHGRQNRELLRLHGDRLHPLPRRQLTDFLAAQDRLSARLRYAATGEVHRQTLGSDFVLRALQVLGRV